MLVPHGQSKVGVMPCVGPTWPEQGWCHALCWSHMARVRLVSCPVLVPHGQSKADVTPVQLGLVCFSVAPLCDARHMIVCFSHAEKQIWKVSKQLHWLFWKVSKQLHWLFWKVSKQLHWLFWKVSKQLHWLFDCTQIMSESAW